MLNEIYVRIDSILNKLLDSVDGTMKKDLSCSFCLV